MTCPSFEILNRYHDGELSPADAAVVASHLPACATCTQTVASLQKISAQVASAKMPAMDPALPSVWLAALRKSQERSVLRLATWLTAAAAMVLLTVSVWHVREPQPKATVTVLDLDNTMLVREEAGTPASSALAAADWMTSDLSSATTEQQWH